MIRYIILIVLIVIILFMPYIEQKDIDSLKNELKMDLSTLEKRISELENAKLDYNSINPNLQSSIEKSSDQFLLDKVFNLVWKKTFHYSTFFDAIDSSFLVDDSGWDTYGSAGASAAIHNYGVDLSTGVTNNNYCSIDKIPGTETTEDGILSFYYPSFFRVVIGLSAVTNQTAYIMTGYNTDDTTGNGYGFKIVNGNLYGYSVSLDTSSSTSVLLQTISVNTTYTLEAYYHPDKGISFTVATNVKDRTNKGFISTNLPRRVLSGVPQTNSYLFLGNIKTSANADKILTLIFFEYFQQLNISTQ